MNEFKCKIEFFMFPIVCVVVSGVVITGVPVSVVVVSNSTKFSVALPVIIGGVLY